MWATAKLVSFQNPLIYSSHLTTATTTTTAKTSESATPSSHFQNFPPLRDSGLLSSARPPLPFSLILPKFLQRYRTRGRPLPISVHQAAATRASEMARGLARTSRVSNPPTVPRLLLFLSPVPCLEPHAHPALVTLAFTTPSRPPRPHENTNKKTTTRKARRPESRRTRKNEAPPRRGMISDARCERRDSFFAWGLAFDLRHRLRDLAQSFSMAQVKRAFCSLVVRRASFLPKLDSRIRKIPGRRAHVRDPDERRVQHGDCNFINDE